MVLASGIARVLVESKSISGKSQRIGYRAELNVIKLLESKNWSLCFQNLKTTIAEIDLIFEKTDQIILIEVKTLNDSWRAFERIQPKQIEKLQKNLTLFAYKFRDKNFRAFIAWVDRENKISFIEVN